jgi:glycosyltransferase involved in cell wall biosynthesis
MRIRFFNTYEPVTTFYRDLLPALARRGIQVEVYIAGAEYRPDRGRLAGSLRQAGLTIKSFPSLGLRPGTRLGKAGIMLAYAGMAAWASMFSTRVDINLFLTQPPLFALWGWMLKWLRGQRYFCVVMDLYPQAAIRDGLLPENGPAARLLGALARLAWKGADGIVVVGRCQRESLVREGIPERKIHLIPNWVNASLVHAVPPDRNFLRHELGLKQAFVILYSGNMGAAHEFGTLLDAAGLLLAYRAIRFLLIGDGAGRPGLEREIRARELKNVGLLPFQPAGRLAESLSLGDLHIVTLKDGFEGVVVPSKAYGAQAVGKPLIYVGRASGEIARMVNEAGIGAVIRTGDSDGLRRAILSYYKNPRLRKEHGRKALALYRRQYSPEHSLSAYQELLLEGSHD